MSSTLSQKECKHAVAHIEDLDDAERGMYEKTQSFPVRPPLATHVDQKTQVYSEAFLSPISSIHEGITPSTSMPVLSLTEPAGEPQNNKPTAAPKRIVKPRRVHVFQLWFNTYRKFFTLVTLLNLAGIITAALGRFPYAENHLGALVLGNLLCAILMRNELFLRFLYLISIYGLRSVSFSFRHRHTEY